MNDDTRGLILEFSGGATARWSSAAGWLVIAAGTAWLSLRVGPSGWLAYVPLCVATASGFLFRSRWFRWVAVPCGMVLLALFGLVSVAAAYPQLAVWWLGLAAALFGLWTILAGLAGFPRKAVKQRAA